MSLQEENQVVLSQIKRKIETLEEEIKEYKSNVKNKRESTADEVHFKYLTSLSNRLAGLESESRYLKAKFSASSPPKVNCFDILSRRGGCVDIDRVLTEDIGFKIPIANLTYVESFPTVFEYGQWSHCDSVGVWLQHNLVGSSEHAVISLDSNWEGVLQGFLPGLSFYRDQYHPSSIPKYSPDLTVVYNNCVVIRAVATASELDMTEAEISLTKKFQVKSYEMFPVSSAMIGVCTSSTLIKIFKISYDYNSKQYKSTLFPKASYRVEHIDDRLRFLVDMVKILRWIYTVNRPLKKFHLLPNVRTLTNNDHYVTWNGISIIKEFNIKTSIDLKYIATVYQSRLLNVEHGEVIDFHSPSISIIRVGNTLSQAISAGYAKDIAYEQIEAGINQLHGLGLGHGDIKVNNIFVDDNDIVFLGDLEYCAPLDSIIPDERRPTALTTHIRTIEDFDGWRLSQLKLDLAKL